METSEEWPRAPGAPEEWGQISREQEADADELSVRYLELIFCKGMLTWVSSLRAVSVGE